MRNTHIENRNIEIRTEIENRIFIKRKCEEEEEIGYAVLVKKVGEKVGNFRINPYFFVVKFSHLKKKSGIFRENYRHFPKLSGFKTKTIYKARHATLQSLRENRNIRTWL
jgi:hypothetical protein